MKKIIIIPFLLIAMCINAQQNLDSLHNLINIELKNKINELENNLNSVDEAIQAKVASEINKLENVVNNKNTEIDKLSKSLNSNISNFKSDLQNLKTQLNNNESALYSIEMSLEKLNKILDSNNIELNAINTDIDTLSVGVANNLGKADGNTVKINDSKTQSDSYFNYVFFGILILLILSVLIFIVSNKKNKTALSSIDETKKNLEHKISDALKANVEFAEQLEKSLKLVSESPSSNGDDHQLILDFAAEIINMENNMSRMNPDDRGLKRIKRAVENMRNIFSSLDYELPMLLNSEVIFGQNIEIDRQIPDDTVEAGKQIICNVLKAQVLYKEKEIQRAKVDVKFNPET